MALAAVLMLLLPAEALAAPATETFRDEFGAISYSGNDGTLSWAAGWVELGESNGSSSGRVRVVSDSRCVAGNCLRIGADEESINGRGAQRGADLSGATSATLTFSSGTGLAFTRSSPVVPFDAEIRLRVDVIDTDAAFSSANPVDFGAASPGSGVAFDNGKEMRYGRLVVTNALGTELLDLSVPVQAQYYGSSGYWVNNADDVCSSLNAGTDLNLTQVPPGLSSAQIAYDPFLLGDPGLSFIKPGMGNTGYIDIEVDLSTATGGDLEWLFYDWDGDSSYDDNPTGRATFGVYKGGDAMIFKRELY